MEKKTIPLVDENINCLDMTLDLVMRFNTPQVKKSELRESKMPIERTATTTTEQKKYNERIDHLQAKIEFLNARIDGLAEKLGIITEQMDYILRKYM